MSHLSIYSIVFLLIFHSCSLIFESGGEEPDGSVGQIMFPASTIDVPDSVKQTYKMDAERLALRDIQTDVTKKSTLIKIPTGLVDLYFNGLLHIYHAENVAEQENVVKVYNIHTLHRPEIKHLLVAVDTTVQWVKMWQEGYRFTGNVQIDKLLSEYKLDLNKYHRWENRHLVELEAENALNILALSQKFIGIDGVIYAEPNNVVGDGNDISAFRKSDYVVYEYSLGYGDCLAGCIHKHYWTFRVSYNGNVEFVNSYGSPLK